MKIKIDPLKENPLTLMRRVGYAFQRREGGEQAWVRILGASGYPRFHIYTKQERGVLVVNIHLDHKKHTYGEEVRHHADYEKSVPLEEEITRLLTAWGESATIVRQQS